MSGVSTTLFLLRHAAHDRVDNTLCGRLAGVHLGDAGRRQAERLADRLAAASLDAVYSSPQPRARETAAPIAARHSFVVTTSDALDEIDFGDWTGRRFDALAGDPAWQSWNAIRAGQRPPGGESMAAAQARMMSWMGELPARHPDRAVAGVSHADVIKAAIAGLLNLSLDSHARFEISPASISTLALWPGGGKVVGLNEGLSP